MGTIHPALEHLRALAAELPGTAEELTWEHPTFRVGNGRKIFATFSGETGEPSISVKQTKPDQALLVSDPRFEVAPYVGRHGWVLIRVDEVPADMIAELVESSYRLVAGKRLVKQLDELRGA